VAIEEGGLVVFYSVAKDALFVGVEGLEGRFLHEENFEELGVHGVDDVVSGASGACRPGQLTS
jgi:hypothetical protein